MDNQIFHLLSPCNDDEEAYFITCINGNGYYCYENNTILGTVIIVKNDKVISKVTRRLSWNFVGAPVSFRHWQYINSLDWTK